MFRIFVDPYFLFFRWGFLSPEMRGSYGSLVFIVSCQPVLGLAGEGLHFWGWKPFSFKDQVLPRFIDDLLFVCSNTVSNFVLFLDYLNDNCLNLQFTGQMNGKSISFLDVTLFSEEGHIQSNIYRKSNSVFLRADSGHPHHITRGIPVGQFLRLQKLCSRDDDFKREKRSMNDRLLRRGYDENTLHRAIDIAEGTDREKLLCDKTPRP